MCRHAVTQKHGAEPSGRADAAALTQALQEALPAGAVKAKYKLSATTVDEAASAFANLMNVRNDFHLIDLAVTEAASLIGAECLERSEVLHEVCSL